MVRSEFEPVIMAMSLDLFQWAELTTDHCCGNAKGVSKNKSDTLKGIRVLIEERGGRVRAGGGEVSEKLLWQSIQPAQISGEGEGKG